MNDILDRLSNHFARTDDETAVALIDALRAEARNAAARIAALEQLATRDPLTGVLNRRGFDDALERALAGAQRSGKGGVLVMIDLDGFKPVNDAYGHAAGDEVLKRVAGLLTAGVRATDVVARIGGDEFAVLLTETEREDGVDRAEALSREINASVAMWRGRPIQLHASLGLQSFGPEDSGDTVMQAADAAMYRIKSLKRSLNRSSAGAGVLTGAR